MKKTPLVSILVAAYNAEKYIKEAIDSALAQTYPNVEIIVVDDGSRDRTGEIVKAYTDPRIRYVYEERQDIVGARNRLLQEAKGAFLTYLDHDDIYLPEKVEEEIRFLEEHPEDAAVYCAMKYFFDGAPTIFYRHIFGHYSGNVFEPLLNKMFITNTAFMMRRKVYDELGGYNPATGRVEDWEYFLRMSYRGYRIAYLDKELVRYRLRWDSSTDFASQVAVKTSLVKIFEHVKSYLTPEERERYRIDYWISKRKESLLIALLSAGKKKEARGVLAEIKASITPWKYWVLMTASFLPSRLLAFSIENAWNWRKRKYFVPLPEPAVSNKR